MPAFLFVLLILNFQFFHCGYHNKNCGNKCYRVGNGAEYRTPVTPRNFGRVITKGTFITNSPIRDKIIASADENLVNNVIQ